MSAQIKNPPFFSNQVTFDELQPFLEWLPLTKEVWLDNFNLLHPWALVALATLGRRQTGHHLHLNFGSTSGAARFAHATSVEEVVTGAAPQVPHEPTRTVRMRKIKKFPEGFAEIERVASEITNLLVTSEAEEEAAKTVRHVIVELLRNVVQHSHDPLGGVVMAQRMNGAGRPTIQVAVGDAGIGIFKALAGMHSELKDARTALEKAIQPHISGTFAAGETGTSTNAGLGLFFISEMTKLTAGKMLLASRGAAFFLRAGEDDPAQHHLDFLSPDVGFDGTLVAFEAPIASVHTYKGMIEEINERAKQRTPGRAISRWLRFVEESPPGVTTILVKVASENTAMAESFAASELLPRLIADKPVALDFRNFEIVTQSFAHALLYKAVRTAWANKVPIYIVKAKPAVVSTLEFLDNYAQSG